MGKYLITGASGFIGKALVERLKQGDNTLHLLSSYDGDIASRETLLPYTKVRFDRVFHLAAKTFVPDSWENPDEFYKTNILGAENVANFCAATKSPLTFVSAYIYGNQKILPIKETALPDLNNPYALSKYTAEKVCELLSVRFATPTIVIRPFNIYGTGQSKFFLIPMLIDQILSSRSVKVKDLYPKRDYLFVDDLIDALIASIPSEKKYMVLNIGSGVSYSVLEIIEILQKISGESIAIDQTGEVRINEIANVVADISCAAKELNWTPSLSIESGLRVMLKSAQADKKLIRNI